MTQCYSIIMYTPMGKKHGELTLTISGAAVTGTLFLFQKQTPVTGAMMENGVCRMQGAFITLLHTFQYEATGQIRKDGLELTVRVGSRTYHINGISTNTE